jgi:hypothetical protein
MGSPRLFNVWWTVWYCMGAVGNVQVVGAAAADASVFYNQKCHLDKFRLVHNETVQSDLFYPYIRGDTKKCGRVAKLSDSKCGSTTDYTNWTDGENYVTDACSRVGGTFYARYMHLYCGRDDTYHDLNFPFCMAATCANGSDRELGLVIQSVYFPVILRRSRNQGFHCAISASPRTKGW